MQRTKLMSADFCPLNSVMRLQSRLLTCMSGVKVLLSTRNGAGAERGDAVCTAWADNSRQDEADRHGRSRGPGLLDVDIVVICYEE